MSLRRYLPSLLAVTILLPALAHADDQVPPAYSHAGKLNLCAGVGDNNPPIDPAICKKNGYDKVSDELDRALQARAFEGAGQRAATAQARPGLFRRDGRGSRRGNAGVR